MRISSTRNPLVRYVRSLERATVRRREGVYLAEGVRLVSEAVATGQEAPLVLYDPEHLSQSKAGSLLLSQLPRWARKGLEVAPAVLAAAAQTETPAGVIAALRYPETPELSRHGQGRFGVALDGLADPGNAGTILRTADAAGVDFLVTTAGSVDLYAPKVVRAGMGAHFRLPLYPGLEWEDLLAALPAFTPVAAAAGEGASIYRFSWPQQTLLVVGSEAQGLSAAARAAVQRRIHIPMRPGVESLNASVAASIMIYASLGPSLEAET